MASEIGLKVSSFDSTKELGGKTAYIDAEALASIGAESGDCIEIRGKRTIACVAAESDEKGAIKLDSLSRKSVGVSVGGFVTVRRCCPKPAAKIRLCPDASSISEIRMDEEDLKKLFRNRLEGRPLCRGMQLRLNGGLLLGKNSVFSVLSTSPEGIVAADGNTEITVEDRPASRDVMFSSIGGLREEIELIRENIEIPLKNPEIFRYMHIEPPRGILLCGPPGTGKTMLARAAANESGAHLILVSGPELTDKYSGKSEEKLRGIFDEAHKNAPSIIVIDEIDAITPRRENANNWEISIVEQLLALMDGIGSEDDSVIVIGTTNDENRIDSALRRAGRFDTEIFIGIPGEEARREILEIYAGEMPLGGDVSLEEIAAKTPGFVGADIKALCREASMRCIRRTGITGSGRIPESELRKMAVTMADFREAFNGIGPSGMRGAAADVPNVTWNDIGGLDYAREKLMEAVPSPGTKEAYARLGIRPAKGVLLYGPPGTGKTLMAKAMANEAGLNFISVSGPELISKLVGDSEKSIRDVFSRAARMAPSILFFDEFDSIASIRGSHSHEGMEERIVAQLLTCMDGLENLEGVLVMAATNRIDMIDPALLRPGRFDTKIEIGKPDRDARSAILLKIAARSRIPAEESVLRAAADRTEGYVGADLGELCRRAALNAYARDHDAASVAWEDFEKAIEQTGKSKTTSEIRSENAGKDSSDRMFG